jgi:sigma-B regulation protein RsbU (phosphoserine phosphatase)
VAELVSARVHGPQVDAPRTLTGRVVVSGEPARAQVTEIRPFEGVHWHVVTVLPEASFLKEAVALQNRAAVLALVAIAGGLGVGLMLSRRLARPLEQLSGHVARIGAGDFDSRLELRDARELHHLSHAVNQMAGDLKERMRMSHAMALATHVQQSLLPASIPDAAGLDIVGFSRYCDETGGDYYDFLQLDDGTGNVMVAVGDVTSHGIGPALLMATARGALHASAPGERSPARIMTRINRVLADDVRHGLFMTMALVVVDRQARVVRWASAGHDPVLVYHPKADEFDELNAGDVPLGIESEVVFHDHCREGIGPGSVLVVGTDGIWEARNPAREMYGKARLRQVIRAHASEPAVQIVRAIERSLTGFLEGAPIHDDVTYVVIRVRE